MNDDEVFQTLAPLCVYASRDPHDYSNDEGTSDGASWSNLAKYAASDRLARISTLVLCDRVLGRGTSSRLPVHFLANSMEHISSLRSRASNVNCNTWLTGARQIAHPLNWGLCSATQALQNNAWPHGR